METKGRFNKDEARLDNIETYCSNMSASIKSLVMQVGQLASKLRTQIKGKFPSDTEHNHREQCDSITLRNGREVESLKPKESQSEKIEEKVEVEKEPPKGSPKN